MAHEVCHLASGDARGNLDDGNAAVRRRDQLRERDRVAQAERSHRLDCDLLGESQLLGRDRRWVDVDPADAEADARRTQPIGERDRRRLAVPGDHDAVQLDPLDELLQERLVGRRLRDRLRQVALDFLARFDPKDGPLSSRVDRLQDGRERDRCECGVDVRAGAEARVRRLRQACGAECVAHGALVRQEVRGVRADSRQAESLRDRRHHRNGAICRHRQRPIDTHGAGDFDDLRHGREVDDLRDVRRCETRCVPVAVDCSDTQSARACLLDRTPLMAPCAYEQNRRHGRRC